MSANPFFSRSTFYPNFRTIFRFGHSLVTSKVEMTNEELGKKPFNLTDHFFDTSLVCEGRIDDLVTGMCFQGAEQVNNIMSDGLRNRLFPHNKTSKFGGDLAVRNIMVSPMRESSNLARAKLNILRSAG